MNIDKVKRRREVRYQLKTPLPVRVLLRRLRGGSSRGVSGYLVDASKRGMGVLVQEHVALDTRCRIELICNGIRRLYKGEVCYGTRTPSGIRLGILLPDSPDQPLMVFLQQQGVDLQG